MLRELPKKSSAVVMEAVKSGNVAEICRKYEISAALYYRWKDRMEKGSLAGLGGEKRS
jgi:transposase-like protein